MANIRVVPLGKPNMSKLVQTLCFYTVGAGQGE